ncbi:ATP-binding protein [Verrucomicrobia bacterium]|nr:ATP-binding protein [Verrucomicrobiota bacterium]
MTGELANSTKDAWSAFRKDEEPVVIHNCKVGCVLGIIFMPAGALLDFFVYPDNLVPFITLRLVCSALLLGVLATFNTAVGQTYHRALAQVMVSLPLVFISGMIFMTEGATSPYYAGLNLVLMGAGLVLRWSLEDSIILICIATTTYLVACYAHPTHFEPTLFFNNIYFLIVTGVFIATGTYFNDRLRFREWKLTEQIRIAKEETEEANTKLRELDEAKSTFFANISHELRTPLTLLLTPLESLISRAQSSELSQHNEILTIMHQNGLKLLKQINDLLELVRFDANASRLEKSNIRVSRFLDGICLSFKGLVEEKKLQFRYDVPMIMGTLNADREKLEKVFRNLIHNAVKFTGPGGTVSIQAKTENSELHIEVSDTGIGISEENLPRLFDRFWQADPSARRKHQGTGIGLALAQEIVTAHDGTITPSSQSGKGTTMSVILPGLTPTCEAEEAETLTAVGATVLEDEEIQEENRDILHDLFRRAEIFTSAANTIKGLPIQFEDDRSRLSNKLPQLLIADDEPQMRIFLRTQLRDSYQILEASDGQEAFEMARQYHPSVILMDNMMPEVDGLEASRKIKETDSTKGIPILMLTARADENTKLDALAVGVNDFLSKPFSLTELHTRLKNLVASAKFEQELARKNRRLNITVEELNDTIQRLKDTETQLVQAEKMSSLGTMSAGIVHEINNPMNYVQAATQALATIDVGPESKADFDDIISDISEGVGRVIEIVSSLLSFAHPDSENFREYSAHEIVEGAMRLLSTQLNTGIEIEIETKIPDDVYFYVSRNPFIQITINLIQNAVDAMQAKEYGENESPNLIISANTTDKISTLTIRDNGLGISEEIRNKIFDPFFTTKDVGEGTGLGLSICYRIAEENKGRILLDSSLGEFTEFKLEFPSMMPV